MRRTGAWYCRALIRRLPSISCALVAGWEDSRWFAAATCCMTLAVMGSGCASHHPESPFQRAYAEHALAPVSLTAGDVTAQWFGVSTLLFDDQQQSLIIDGFFSRPPFWTTVFGNIGPDPDLVRTVLAEVKPAPLAAVFVSHAHHDHALDAPAFARDRIAPLHGSGSVLNLARGYGATDEWLHLIRPNVPVEVGGFRVTAVPTPHSHSPFPLEPVIRPFPLPVHALAFSAGENYSFLLRRDALRILVVASAGYEPVSSGDAFGDERAGLVFLAIAALGHRDDRHVCEFWEASVRQRGARRVILIHWDAFTRPLTKPLRPYGWPVDDMDLTYRRLKELAKDERVEINFMKPGERINLSRLAALPHTEVPPPRDCATWAMPRQ